MKLWKATMAALAVCAVFLAVPTAQAHGHHQHHRSAHTRHATVHHARHYQRQHPDYGTQEAQQPFNPFGDAISGGWNTGSDVVARARAKIGATAHQLGLPGRLWCADFMNSITGGGTHSREAKSYLRLPHTSPHVGAIAVLSRGRGGHVGVVSGFDANGNPIIISGNHGHTVGEGTYNKGRVIAYVNASG